MRITTRLGRRMIAVVAAGAVAAGLVAASGLVAPAQAATSLGTLTITPATGNESNSLHGVTSASCPGGSTGIIGYMSGPGITEQFNGVSQSILMSNHVVATDFDFSNIFKDVFVANSIAAPSGTYTVRVACIGADFFTEVGQFSQQVVFTPTSGANNGSYVTQLAVTATSTVLAAGAPDPILAGEHSALTATVTPSAAPGTIQFKNGATNLGAPITVAGGVATLDDTVLPAGTNSLSAVFTPTDSAYGPSTGTKSYVVAGPATLTGTAQVGKTLTCSTSTATGATRSYQWLRDGAVAATTSTASYALSATWYNHMAACKVITSKGLTSVNQTSAAKKIALGAKLVVRTKPKVLGIMKVGKRLTCSPGTWSPAAASYKYQWFRGAKALAGKTAKTYRTVRADKGKLLTCRVTALKTGYASGVAKAPARKVT